MPTMDDDLRCGEAGPARRFDQRNDRSLPLRNQQRCKWPLTWGFGARGGIRTLDLPITSRRAFVQQVLSRPVLAAHVSEVVC
jgi:hypothetical protein